MSSSSSSGSSLRVLSSSPHCCSQRACSAITCSALLHPAYRSSNSLQNTTGIQSVHNIYPATLYNSQQPAN
eukprot:m.316782 g.316782  ORF g.316782 m.316782 type:complete len:71 (+) comp55465_c1_seq1:131-343(+)